MRFSSAVLFCIFLATAAFPQKSPLPEVLIPDPALEANARQMGYEVFKLLPRGTYENPPDSYKDEDNPLGIREGGAYYSFSKRSHSYNQIPQIVLQKEWISVGFYGASYGFIHDLGKMSLSDVSIETPAAQALASYKPPHIEAEARPKRRRREIDGFKFSYRTEYTVGNAYLLRAISFDEADKLVAIQVVSQHPDGSLTIYWRPLKDFAKPILLYQTDEQLREKIADVLTDPRFQGVKFSISNNEVTLTGTLSRNDFSLLISAIQKFRPKGIRNQVSFK